MLSKLIRSLGGRLTLSDDSHGPHAVGLHYDELRRYLLDEGVDQLWHLEPAPRRGDPAVPVPVPGDWSLASFWSDPARSHSS